MENENQKVQSGCIISFTFWLIWKSLGITSLGGVLRQSVFRCVNEFTIKIFNRAVSFNWLWLINVVHGAFWVFFKMAVDRRLTTILRNTQKAPGKMLMANISWLYSQSEEDSAVFNGVSYRTLVNLKIPRRPWGQGWPLADIFLTVPEILESLRTFPKIFERLQRFFQVY